MKKKLNLSDLKVVSFVTTVQPNESKEVKAGYYSLNPGCPDYSTQIDVCCAHPIGYTTIPASQPGGEACPAGVSDYFTECDCVLN